MVNDERPKLCQQTHRHCGIPLPKTSRVATASLYLQSNPTAMLSKSLKGEGKGGGGSSSSFRKLRDAIETNESEHICPFLMDELGFHGNIYLQEAAGAVHMQPTKCEAWINHPSRGARAVSWILSSPSSCFNLEYRRLYYRTSLACSNLHTEV